jgi:hypothetical protein
VLARPDYRLSEAHKAASRLAAAHVRALYVCLGPLLLHLNCVEGVFWLEAVNLELLSNAAVAVLDALVLQLERCQVADVARVEARRRDDSRAGARGEMTDRLGEDICVGLALQRFREMLVEPWHQQRRLHLARLEQARRLQDLCVVRGLLHRQLPWHV